MATKKITQLPTASAVLPTDLVPIVDLNDTMTEKATWSQVVDGLNGLIATLSGSKFSGPVTASVGVSASFFQVGPSPATAGAVRLGNALGINANKDDGSANFSLLKSTFLNDVVVSEETNPGNTYVFGGVGSIYNRATTHYFRSTDGVTTFATMGNGGISGSLTRLTNGTSYLVAGANTTIVTQSNGSILITATGGTAAAGGSTGDFQYNNLGALDGVSGFSYNGQRIALSTPLTASVGLSASFLQVGTANVASSGDIRGASGFSIKQNVNNVDRPIIAGSAGAEVVLGGFGANECAAIINRVGTSGAIYNQINSANYLTVGESTISFPSTTSAVLFSGPVTASLGLSASFVTASTGVSASYIHVNSSDGTTSTGHLAIGGTNVPTEGMLRLGSDTGGYRDIIKVRQNGADWSFLNIHNGGASYINVGPTPSVGYAMTWRGYTHLFHGYDGTFDFYHEGNGTYPLRMNSTTGATFSVPVTASLGISGSHGSFGIGGVTVPSVGNVRLGEDASIYWVSDGPTDQAFLRTDSTAATWTVGTVGGAYGSVNAYTMTIDGWTTITFANAGVTRAVIDSTTGATFSCAVTASLGVSASFYNLHGSGNKTPNAGAIRVPYNQGNTDKVVVGLYSDGVQERDFLTYGAGNTWTIGNTDQNVYTNAYAIQTIAQNGGQSHYHNGGFNIYSYGRAAYDAQFTNTGFNLNTLPGGQAANRTTIGHRLTIASGSSVVTASINSGSTLYLTPHVSTQIALYDGTTWWQYSTGQVSLSLSGLTINTNYDVFAYINAGSVALGLGPAWSNATTRATGLSTVDGVLVKTGDNTRRYLGTIRTTSTTTTEDSFEKRFVWNYHNRVRRKMYKHDPTNTWSYGGSFRAANGNTNNNVQYVCGDNATDIEVWVNGMAQYTATGWGAAVDVGLDSAATGSAQIRGGSYTIASVHSWPYAHYQGTPSLGHHTLYWVEFAGNTVNWYGDNGDPSYFTLGIRGNLFG